MITVRLANAQTDISAIMEGARNFASRVDFPALFPKDDAAFVSVVERIMSLDGMEVLLAEHEEKFVGALGVLYSPYLWNPERIVATEIFWWTRENAPFRTARVMMDETMKRIEAKGAIPVFVALETSPDGVGKLYRKLGMAPIETSFMRFF